MTGVVSAYKECLKQLKEMQDLSCSPEAVVAGYSRLATKCQKLQQEQHQLPPKATWKRLVLDMQASVTHTMVFVVGLPIWCRVLHTCVSVLAPCVAIALGVCSSSAVETSTSPRA